MEPRLVLYVSFLTLATIAGVMQWPRLSRADRWISILLVLTILQELVAYMLALAYKNNMASYHVYSPLELCLTCLYLGETTLILRRKRLGIWIGAGGILASICNTVFFQGLHDFNTYFLLLESTVIILLSLISLYDVLMQEEAMPITRTQFWMAGSLLVYWSATYCGWGMYNISPVPRPKPLNAAFVSVLSSANILFYAGIALVFFRYKRLIPSGA